MRKLLPVLLILFLAIGLTGGVLMIRAHDVTTPGVLLLVVGLAGAAGLGFRIGALGGMDPREVSRAIHERAQRNLDDAKGRSPHA